MRQLVLDSTQKELVELENNSFPVCFYIDDFSNIQNGTLSCHWHHELELFFVFNGEIECFINGETIYLQTGEGLFVNSNAFHLLKTVEGCRYCAKSFGMWFSPSIITHNMGDLIYQKYFKPIINGNLDYVKVTSESRSGRKLFKAFYDARDIYDNKAIFSYELSCLSLLCQVWEYFWDYLRENDIDLQTGSPRRRDPACVAAIFNYIHENYSNDLTIDEISKAVGMSRSTCFKYFREYAHQTPMEYLTEYRLHKAERFILESARSLTEISNLCGFTSSSYFTKLFKDKYGLTPREYRKKYI